MGMKELMEDYENNKHGKMVVSFERENGNVDMKIDVHKVSQYEVQESVKSLVRWLADQNDTAVPVVLLAISKEMMREDGVGK